MAVSKAVAAVTTAPPNATEPRPTAAAPAAAAQSGLTRRARLWAAAKKEPLIATLTALIGALTAIIALTGSALVGLMLYLIGDFDDKIAQVDNRVVLLETKMGERFAAVDEQFVRLEAKIDERFVQVDQRFTRLESEVKEINVGLTALIAHLNATEAVENAREFRISNARSSPEPG